MWEKFIEWIGFNNVYQGGQVTGFQFNIHIPYYRGVFISCISDQFLVKVDGVTYPLDKVSLKIGDRVIPWSKLDDAYDVFWYFGDLATVIVEKPGGLEPGLHTVECGLSIRKSYGSPIDPYELLDRGLPKSRDEYVHQAATGAGFGGLQTDNVQMTLVM